MEEASLLHELVEISERNGISTTRSTITSKSPHPGLSERLSHYFHQVAEHDNETSESGRMTTLSDFSDSDAPMKDLHAEALSNITARTLNHHSLNSSVAPTPRKESSRYSSI